MLSLRVKKTISLEPSVLFTVQLSDTDVDSEKIKWIGWEPNTDGKFLPRCVSLASSMDPQRFARQLIPFGMNYQPIILYKPIL